VSQEQQQEPQGPQTFLAVFYDENGEVQVGVQGMARDLQEWEQMLRIAVEKIALKNYVLAREQYQQQRAGGGIIVPQGPR